MFLEFVTTNIVPLYFAALDKYHFTYLKNFKIFDAHIAYCMRHKEARPYIEKRLLKENTHPLFLYLYCKSVCDTAKIWKALRDSEHNEAPFYWLTYCQNVKDRFTFRKRIYEKVNDPEILHSYYITVNQSPEIADKILDMDDPNAIVWQMHIARSMTNE